MSSLMSDYYYCLFSPVNQGPLRPRMKRVNLRDLVFILEQERETNRSQSLFKAFMK